MSTITHAIVAMRRCTGLTRTPRALGIRADQQLERKIILHCAARQGRSLSGPRLDRAFECWQGGLRQPRTAHFGVVVAASRMAPGW